MASSLQLPSSFLKLPFVIADGEKVVKYSRHARLGGTLVFFSLAY